MMKQKDQQLVGAYSRQASFYDKSRFVPLMEEQLSLALLKLTGAQEGMRILDVATGTGRIAIHLAKTGAAVMAIDLTPRMIEEMCVKTQQLGLRNLYVQQANARWLPFCDDCFDVVVSFRFLHLFQRENLNDQIALLREMHRVVKPDGRVVVEYNNAGARWVGAFAQDVFRYLVQGKKPINRVNKRHLKELYRDYQIVGQQGFSWPFMGTVARSCPLAARLLLKLSMWQGSSKYSRHIWIASTKSEYC